jgi:hypothetical protein
MTEFRVETWRTMPPNHWADVVTSDGHVAAFWERPNGRVRFGWDGRAGHPTFDGVQEMRDGSAAIFASPDGAHIAYTGLRGSQQFVGRDAAEDPPLAMVSGSVPPVFSSDGSHLAYGGGRPEDCRLILDGEPVGGRLAPVAAVFSPAGNRLAYAEIRGSSRADAEVRVVIDGAPEAWMTGMRNAGGVMQFSPDGTRFAYCRLDADYRVQWVVDGLAQPAYDEVRQIGLTQLREIGALTRGIGVLEPALPAAFSPDGRRFAYFADVPENGVAIVEDGVPGPVLKTVGLIVFSPDSRHLAYVGQQHDGRFGVVIDGRLDRPMEVEEMGLPVFSPDGRHVAVVVCRQKRGFLRRQSRYALVVDGRVVAEVPGDDASARATFSPDGCHAAWWVANGKTSEVWLDDHPHAPGTRDIISEPAFSRSGRLVYVAQTERAASATVVVDHHPGPVADEIAGPMTVLHQYGGERALEQASPIFMSPDGDHVAWIGKFGQAWRPVIDDEVGPPFDAPLATTFDRDGPSWYLQSDATVLRVTAEDWR